MASVYQNICRIQARLCKNIYTAPKVWPDMLRFKRFSNLNRVQSANANNLPGEFEDLGCSTGRGTGNTDILVKSSQGDSKLTCLVERPRMKISFGLIRRGKFFRLSAGYWIRKTVCGRYLFRNRRESEA